MAVLEAIAPGVAETKVVPRAPDPAAVALRGMDSAESSAAGVVVMEGKFQAASKHQHRAREWTSPSSPS